MADDGVVSRPAQARVQALDDLGEAGGIRIGRVGERKPDRRIKGRRELDLDLLKARRLQH
jgi:hypothetical protein